MIGPTERESRPPCLSPMHKCDDRLYSAGIMISLPLSPVYHPNLDIKKDKEAEKDRKRTKEKKKKKKIEAGELVSQQYY